MLEWGWHELYLKFSLLVDDSIIGGLAQASCGVQAKLTVATRHNRRACPPLLPRRFRHLLDCSEELCDDDESNDCLFYGGAESTDDYLLFGGMGALREQDEDEDPFTDSVC